MIVLPFPPSSLSGHAKGNWHGKSAVVKQWRAKAHKAALGVRAGAEGDIRIHVRFVPPDRRGDRVNFPNRMKPIFDGIADALGVNDSRFLPSYEFAEPEKPGRVEVTIAVDNDFSTMPGAVASVSNGWAGQAATTSGPATSHLERENGDGPNGH